MSTDRSLAWLMDGDPAIRRQVRRDLLAEPEADWRAEQARVATEGWGARLLAHRSPDGRWTRGLYSPKWTSTTYSLLLLWQLGLPRSHRDAAASAELLLENRVWLFGDRKPYWEACVAGFGMVFASGFDADPVHRERLVGEVLAAQLADGGWNCRSPRGATHSSFHTTINILEGLREYAAVGGERRAEVEAAEARAREFFCQHRLYRSHRTGKVVDPRMARLSFPPRWHHDILRTLDYFRAAGAARDERLADAIGVLETQRGDDGLWPLQQVYDGKVWFALESLGKPSRFNTLRALRVLAWWQGDGR